MPFLPATPADVAAVAGNTPLHVWRCHAAQVLGGPAWTLWQDGRPVLVAGLHPFHGEIFEAWLMVSRAHRPGRAGLAALLKGARTIMPDRILIARIDDANVIGQRLAIQADFLPLEEHLGNTGIRTWLRRSVT